MELTAYTPNTHHASARIAAPLSGCSLRSPPPQAYDFDSDASFVGNLFMNAVQPYMSIKPTMPVEGNHEACGERKGGEGRW